MSNDAKKVVTRFAPSPTGFIHIGNVRTALFAYLWARKNNGTFILRIEDTDKEREVVGSIEHIEETLKWFSLDWDYGPKNPGPFGSCIQSERLPSYFEYAKKLVEKGYAYPDPYTIIQVQEFREKSEKENKPFLFRDYRPETFEEWDGKKALRFKVPKIKRYTWHDEARGNLEAGEEALDDFVLMKGDGYPTYNFAHIIDDYFMGVTHIFRSDEFISSTPRFLSLYDALGFTHPFFVTLPPILREDRTKKLGKRDGAKDILEYRNEGYLPDALVNFLALIGWNPGTDQEIFSREDLIKSFSLDCIQKSGAVFNEEKLKWMNKEYIKRLSAEEQFTSIEKILPSSVTGLSGYSREMLLSVTLILIEHISHFGEIHKLAERGEIQYFFEDPKYSAEALFWKDDKDAGHTILKLGKVAELLQNISEENFTSEIVKSAIWDYATEAGRGNVLWPMRYALSGRDKSPDPFTLAGILGKETTIKRIEKARELLKNK